MSVDLGHLTDTHVDGWHTLFEFHGSFDRGWCLLGGQLVWLHACEAGATPPRASVDMDVVVDLRVRTNGLRLAAVWLTDRGFDHDGMSPDGIGHRYRREHDNGDVIVDLLAPDHMGDRANLITTAPARTVEAPGSRNALDSAEPIEVTAHDRAGIVLRPTLAATIAVKAAATTIPGRLTERDWSDAAFLLSLVADPIDMREQLRRTERRHIARLAPLADPGHVAWRQFDSDVAQRGQLALALLRAR